MMTVFEGVVVWLNNMFGPNNEPSKLYLSHAHLHSPPHPWNMAEILQIDLCKLCLGTSRYQTQSSCLNFVNSNSFVMTARTFEIAQQEN